MAWTVLSMQRLAQFEFFQIRGFNSVPAELADSDILTLPVNCMVKDFFFRLNYDSF